MNISLKKALQWRALLLKDILRAQGRQKVFCVGMNKTGTKSIAAALRELGLVVAPSSSAAILLDDWTRRDFRRIKRRCQLFQAFQDSPFSYPYTYQAMDAAFPKS